MVQLMILPLAVTLGVTAQGGYAGFGPMAALPTWLQAVGMLVVGDFAGYWTHRWFHTGPLWPFHAVHHSSTELDWLSSVPIHPVNDVVPRIVQATVLLSLGFPPGLLAAYVPFLTFYAIFLHANLPWDFGPLRLVLTSPAFHRLHHSSESVAINKNLAGLLPVWDVLFGTLHMPVAERPATFGVHGALLPTSVVGLLAYPFGAARGRAASAA
jgi:sterol desaturase/sphingolipid hydroxylase (fatty acid hydroxylase superfamily)